MRTNNPTHVITHHSNGSASDGCISTRHHTVLDIDNWHATRWRGFTSQVYRRYDTNALYHVGYHFVTDLNRRITYQTRDYKEEGAHCLGKNTSSLGWLIIGNYRKCSPDEIGEEDKEFLRKEMLIHVVPAMKEFNIPIENVVPHRHFSVKECHGLKLPNNYFQNFLTEEREAAETKIVIPEVLELREKVVKLEDIVQSLQRLIVMLINMLSKKRLALREKNNAKSA